MAETENESTTNTANGTSRGLGRRIWRSVVRGPLVARTDRERRWAVLNNLVLHLRPVHVPDSTLRFSHTFGLGGSCLVMFGLLAVSGILLMFHYEPSPERAYGSIVALEQGLLFGPLVRAVHHWTANALVVVAGLHLLRVLLTGGFHAPRQFNWVLGLGLLIAVLGANFTGYLLPWDQLAYWAITISTGMLEYAPVIGSWLRVLVRGGEEIGAQTLVIFYTLHTTVVPVLLILLMAFHFWRVRKARGVVLPRRPGEVGDENPQKVLFIPNLLLREAAMACAITAALLVIAATIPVGLGPEANAGMSPNPTKAPWYFAGIQELLIHFHPVFAVIVIPGLALLSMALLPYLGLKPDSEGVWFASRRGPRLVAAGAASGAVLTTLTILTREWWLDLPKWLPGWPSILRDGLLPFVLTILVVWLVTFVARRRANANDAETVLTVFTFLAASLVVATIVCVWFRGPGMVLCWPWSS